jgi:hypothetical protein
MMAIYLMVNSMSHPKTMAMLLTDVLNSPTQGSASSICTYLEGISGRS